MADKTITHFKVKGVPFGVYEWWRYTPAGKKRGLVFRLGPLGHFQISDYTVRFTNGRRKIHTIQIAKWGINGRRKKKAIFFGWHL